ncbi:hypothetical protein MUO71_04760 [Candidatus Bathyarchaeota archaeon]|nr:hypothetical protein [Candidatus Bathyarchaeota archaeon]
MKSIWKNLLELADKGYPQIDRKPGIYFLRWVKGGEPVTINRLVESDSNGLLYIGGTKDLRRRFQRIWRGINIENKTKSKNIHTLRKTIFFCKIHEVINLEEYEIAWQELATKIEVESQEAAALKLYTEKFKEPPPLNLKLCREKYAICGLGNWGDSKWLIEPNEFVKSIIS